MMPQAPDGQALVPLPGQTNGHNGHSGLARWYVYYKLKAEHAPLLLPQVQALLRRMQQQYALHTQLHQREDAAAAQMRQTQEGLPMQSQTQSPAAVLTWMETYQASAASASCMQGQDFALLLQAALEQTQISTWLIGPRHIECFMEVFLCA